MSVTWKTRNRVVYNQYWRKVAIDAEPNPESSVALFSDSLQYWLFPWGCRNFLMPVTEASKQKIKEVVTAELRGRGILAKWNDDTLGRDGHIR
jgi:hypothetical protein